MPINVNEQGRPWTASGGGPVIVVPAETAAAWRGTLPPVGASVPPGWTWGAGGIECDYDRACDPRDAKGTPYGGFAWLDVGGKPALILDAEITTEWLAEDGGGTIIRCSVDEASKDPATVATWSPFPAPELEVTDGRLFMFDSAFEGNAVPESIKASDGVGVIALAPGKWKLTCGTNADEVDFIRFRR